MIAARSVTGFALQLAVSEWGVGILRHCVLGAEDGQSGLVVVTLEAGVGTLAAVVGEFSPVAIGLGIGDRGQGDGHEGHRQYRGLSYSHFHEHQYVSSLVELELANTVHLSRIGARAWSVTELTGLDAGRYELAVSIFRRGEIAAVLDHVIHRKITDMAG